MHFVVGIVQPSIINVLCGVAIADKDNARSNIVHS